MTAQGPLDAHNEVLEVPDTVLVAPGIDTQPLEAAGWHDTGDMEGEHRIFKRT